MFERLDFIFVLILCLVYYTKSTIHFDCLNKVLQKTKWSKMTAVGGGVLLNFQYNGSVPLFLCWTPNIESNALEPQILLFISGAPMQATGIGLAIVMNHTK